MTALYQEEMAQAYYESAIGTFILTAKQDTLYRCELTDLPDEVMVSTPSPFLTLCLEQLQAYFAGQLQQFSFAMAPQGSVFAKQVWQQLLSIPFATTLSYQAVATALGRPKAARAVGQAVARNPIALVIPCHRVVGSQGRLGGYTPGIWRKTWLLAHERRIGATLF